DVDRRALPLPLANSMPRAHRPLSTARRKRHSPCLGDAGGLRGGVPTNSTAQTRSGSDRYGGAGAAWPVSLAKFDGEDCRLSRAEYPLASAQLQLRVDSG